MDRCNELCTKDAIGTCAVCEARVEADRFFRFWFKGGLFVDGVRALKSRGFFAFFVSRRTSLLLGLGALLLVLGIYSIYRHYWVIPNQYIASVKEGALTSKELNDLRNSIRQTFVQALGLLGGLIGGAALLGGLYFTAQTLRTSQETLRVNQKTLESTQQGQITERFTTAIEQLGDKEERLMVRLGGIYALEQVAKDSDSHHWPVMEVLTAFVREAPATTLPPDNTSGEKGTKESLHERKLPSDIQAILTIIGQRTRTFRNGEAQRLNLRNTALQGADLQGAQLQGAELWKAQLQGANLMGAQLQGAVLWKAQLQGANLWGAQLQGTDLRSVVNLTQDQINVACIDENTTLPAGLTRPAPCPPHP